MSNDLKFKKKALLDAQLKSAWSKLDYPLKPDHTRIQTETNKRAVRVIRRSKNQNKSTSSQG